MNIENLEALNNVLEDRQNEIDKLKEKVERMERIKENAHDRWDETAYIPRDDFRKDLPIPRLEMIYWEMDYGSAWTYGIVRLAPKGLREDWNSKDLVFIPLSQTTTTGDVRVWPEKGLDKPFRDSTHFAHDMEALNLPGFITCPSLGLIEKFRPMAESQLVEYEAELQGNIHDKTTQP